MIRGLKPKINGFSLLGFTVTLPATASPAVIEEASFVYLLEGGGTAGKVTTAGPWSDVTSKKLRELIEAMESDIASSAVFSGAGHTVTTRVLSDTDGILD